MRYIVIVLDNYIDPKINSQKIWEKLKKEKEKIVCTLKLYRFN